MCWPFTSFAETRIKQRKIVHVTINQDVAPDGKVTSGTAFFTDDKTVSAKAAVPIEALGQLVLAYPERFGLRYVELTKHELPTARQARRGKLYLAVKENPDGGWIAFLGGLNISPPVCDCRQHGVDWHQSKLWPSRNRALGMMVFEWSSLIKLFVHYEYNHQIKLRHPDDPTSDGAHDDGHCCCGP
jgi:hypothetical protein